MAAKETLPPLRSEGRAILEPGWAIVVTIMVTIM